MRKLAALLVCVVAGSGCSTAPIAGFLDCVAPSRGKLPDRDEPRGDIPLPEGRRPVTGDPFLQLPRLPER